MGERCLEPCPDVLRVEQQLKDLIEQNGKDHKELREDMNQYKTAEAVQEVQYKNILEKLDNISADVAILKAKPGKRWDSVVEKCLLLLVGAIMSYLLTRLGLPG